MASEEAHDYKALFATIDDHVKLYEQGTITISDDIEFSMRQTVRQTTHYILSKYLGTQNDALGRRKPFRNIGNAIVDLEWRAKNIDRKSIEAQANDGDYIFSLVVNKELQKWMRDNNFGKTIDDYQRKKSEYGSVLPKKTESATELIIEMCKWEYMAVDPRDIAKGIKVEKNYLSPLDLLAKKGIWDDAPIDLALAAHKKQRTKDENRIEVLDVEGEFPDEFFAADEYEEQDADAFHLRNAIVAVVGTKKFCLYQTTLTESRFKHDKRKEVEGCDFGMGVWQEIFEPQIWTNEAVISEKFAMDLAGKVVVKTNKKSNLASAASLKDGEMIELDAGEFFDPVQLMPNALPQYQNQIDSWFVNTQRDQSAYPGMTGEQPKASTPGISLQLQAAQGGSIFNKRRDQDGFFLGGIILDWVMPFLVKRINAEHTLTASYSPGELEQLDEAIAQFHADKHVKSRLLDPSFADRRVSAPTQLDKDAIVAGARAKLMKRGSERSLFIPKGYITMKRVREKVRFNITDEMQDDQRRLNGLATTLASLAPEDPQRASIIQEMMETVGISPTSFPVAGGGNSAPKPPKESAVQAVLPEGQKV